MTNKKLFNICKQHGLYCELTQNFIHLTDKHGHKYESIKVDEGDIIHSTQCGDMNLYEWLGY